MRFNVLFSFFIYFACNAQTVYFQDILKGGVTSAGANLSATGNNPLTFNLFIEPGSTVKKAFLIAGADGTPEDIQITINGIDYLLNIQSIVTSGFLSWYLAPPTSSVHVLDLTNYINPNITNYTINAPVQNFFDQESYFQYNLVVIYENPILQELAVEFILNNQNVSGYINYSLSNLLPINTANHVGCAVIGRHFCDTIQDGSYVSVNSLPIGLIGGNDANSPPFCSGVRGDFYYQNSTLYGLDDDTPDPFMAGSDALANIQSYVTNNDVNLDIEFQYQNLSSPSGVLSNPIMAISLAYTTPCSPFTVTSPKDTTLCQGATLQLSATGGTPNANSMSGYKWSPATGLSCTDCPNPVFTADSTVFYTVRVWNNDSCSVVRPVHVIVKNERGKAPDVSVSPTFCGDSTGVATASVVPIGNVVSWQTVGGTPQSSPILQNLAPGFHTIFYTDNNGCQSLDTTIFIPTVNPFTVSFVANPPNGAAPLSVDFVNTSVSANNFEWFINGQFVGNSLTNFVFDTIGLYTVSLVGWQNNVLCIDTVSVQIFVFDSLIVSLPNVFTPNGDGVNELLTITTNQDVTYEFSIQNRWGNTMLTGNGNLQKSIPQAIWDGNDASDGVYFVLLKFTQIDGKEIKAQGFVQVFGR